MKRFEKYKVILTVVAAAVAVTALFFGINLVEKNLEKKAYADSLEDEEDEDDYDDEDYELSEDEIKIGNTVYRYDSDITNYLIIGTDESGDQNDGKYHGKMADFLLLVVLNRIDNNFTFLQIDRDTVTYVPMMNEDGSSHGGKEMQICTAHWYGGNEEQSCENTATAVSELLGGIPIDGYYEVNMEQIPLLNSMVGGVTVTVSSDLTAADPTLIEGEIVTLSDEQAYTYVHSRMDVADGTNTDRMRRQHEYMDAYLQKVIDTTKANPNFPNEMFKKMKDYACTNMTGNDISRILNRISQGENHGILTFEGAHKLGMLLDDGLEHQEFYIDYNSFLDIMTATYHLEEVMVLTGDNNEDD
ncbi:MAG: LytR family transcriptional regulator [Butyrivibrio sp.]|jgi:LCP family protein required for cell wall assembly|nr:LytR family transcriptional regulator [Butyrivibrio sp.]